MLNTSSHEMFSHKRLTLNSYASGVPTNNTHRSIDKDRYTHVTCPRLVFNDNSQDGHTILLEYES